MSVALDQACLASRIARLEDRAEIAELAVLYGFVMDERDIAALPQLFAPDARLCSADGVFAATGLGEIAATYQGRFAALDATNHVSHGHVIRFHDDDHAYGLVASHAEVVRDGTPMLVALRYRDEYVRTADGWRFLERLMSYMYYVDVREYAEALATPLRNRAYGDQRPADWPEALVDSADGADGGWLPALMAEPLFGGREQSR